MMVARPTAFHSHLVLIVNHNPCSITQTRNTNENEKDCENNNKNGDRNHSNKIIRI